MESDFEVRPSRVMRTLSSHILVDGFHLVVDLKRSKGSYMVSARSGKKYLDMYSYFSTLPIGHNHPKMRDAQFVAELREAAMENPANSDVYTEQYAEFVKIFSRLAKPGYMKHLFFISGGALAVENALKASFDWKVRKNFNRGGKKEMGSQAMHFRNAFHGRSGYTLSLTNTSDIKTKYFPKFKWPRIDIPKLSFPVTKDVIERVEGEEQRSIRQINQAIKRNGKDIACMIIEPIQGEGGDNHFRPEFLQELQRICNDNDILFVLDEIQTGFGTTGKMWAFEHFGIKPDIVAFGKKSQVCGIMCSKRIDEVKDNVFSLSSRINSTWGGSLADMVRCRRYLEIIKEEGLVENARKMGSYFLSRLEELQGTHDDITNSRGRGCFLAFDMPMPRDRDSFITDCWRNQLAVLSSWPKSVRFRPPLNISREEIDIAVRILDKNFRHPTKHVHSFRESV